MNLCLTGRIEVTEQNATPVVAEKQSGGSAVEKEIPDAEFGRGPASSVSVAHANLLIG